MYIFIYDVYIYIYIWMHVNGCLSIYILIHIHIYIFVHTFKVSRRAVAREDRAPLRVRVGVRKMRERKQCVFDGLGVKVTIRERIGHH